MPDDGRGDDRAPIEGISGGPGPTPPGFDDGTPHLEAPRTPGEDPPAPEAADREGERGGEPTREAAPVRWGAARGDPEEPDPS
jgi:hypothetical protein